jgi:hypothetical protein
MIRFRDSDKPRLRNDQVVANAQAYGFMVSAFKHA